LINQKVVSKELLQILERLMRLIQA